MIKIKNLEIELFKIKYADKPSELESALRELKKIEVIDKNLHEIKNDILRDYGAELEMVGRLKIADQTREIHIRFRSIDDFESFNNATKDAFFNSYIYKINTHQFNLVNRSQFGNGCDFKNENIYMVGAAGS